MMKRGSIRHSLAILVLAVAASQLSASELESRAASDLELSQESSRLDVTTFTVPPPMSSDAGTLTIGAGAIIGCRPGNPLYGFLSTRSSGNFGSYSPIGLTGGKSIGVIVDVETGICSGSGSSFTVTGFSSDPGISWLTSITCNGVVNFGSGAKYVYSSGDATWAWGQLFGLESHYQSNVSCTIVHN